MENVVVIAAILSGKEKKTTDKNIMNGDFINIYSSTLNFKTIFEDL